MGNNLHKIEKDLRSIAKRYKSVKYSVGLAILFLMLGISAFSEEVNIEKSPAQIATREELKTSVGDVQTKLNVMRSENKKNLKNSRLELIQLTEQGDQVVKSPWASWQFGMNYFHEKFNGVFKGRGDKSQKYLFNGVYTRGDWKERNAMDALESQKVSGVPLTPGNDSLASWKNVSNTSNGGVKIEKNTAINSSTNGNRSWGLVDLLNLKEPTNEVEILARISPKEVNKKVEPLDIKGPKVETITAPIVKPNVNTPLPAPEIKLPKIEAVVINPLTITAPGAPSAPTAPTIGITITAPNAPSAPTVPSISVNPSAPGTVGAPTITINVKPPKITALNISTPPTVISPNVTSPNIVPVDFVIDPAGDSNTYLKSTWTEIPTTVNVTALENRNYITLNAVNGSVQSPANQIINVTAKNNRALVVDEALNGGNVTYKGSINLQKSQNVGIDLQGTHQGSKSAPALLTVNNAGNIIGLAKDGGTINKEQIAFGFNNADASRNTTMSHMINSGTISLNAPSSAGIQLKPEDPHYWQPKSWSAAPLQINKKSPNKTMGRVLMKAENTGTIELKGTGSFGIVTIFNKGVPKNLFETNYKPQHEDLRSERLYDGQRVLPGGEIGRSALNDDKYTSGIYNTGTINITGDNSIALGLLQEIQEVKFGGNINIGTTAVTQETGVSNLANSVSKTYNVNKVEEAVGVFAGVPTMPVRPGEKDTLIVDNTLGNVATNLVGTETVELIKTKDSKGKDSTGITLGEHATESIGALVGDTEVDLNDGKVNGVQTSGRKLKRSGDIIARAGYTIAVGGYKNYGFVVSNSGHSSSFLSTKDVDDLQYKADKVNHGKGINEGKINVTGISSIGFALIKGGNSANKGTISVEGNAEDSIGFYGKEDNFSNTGTIQVTSVKSKNKAVVLDGTNSKNRINFTNTGNIYVNTADNANTNLIGTGNIGVYAQRNYKFDHDAGKLNVGTNAVGLYVKDATGEVNIKAPINLAASGTGTNKGTTVGIYSDGDAKVNFTDNTTLTIGEGAVGLYSSNPTNFDKTFTIANGKTLSVDLGKNSTFGLLNGNKNATASPVLSKFLNASSTTGKISITQFGEGASLFYATSKAKAVLDEDYTITNGGAESTSVLVADDGATVEIASGKTLTTNTNVGLIATKGAALSGAVSEAKNSGTIVSNRTDKGIGIYADAAKGNNSGTITMSNQNAVGMLGVLGSSLINTGKIGLGGVSSAGMYGEDSNITNSTTASEINVSKETSAGIYAKMKASITDITSKNEGKIKILADGAGKSAGMYSLMENGSTQKLTTQNTETIEVAQQASAGMFAKNESGQANGQSEVLSSGLIKMTGINSVGIIGKKSKITNSGTGAKGIEISGAGSAGILATDESEVINSGRIEGNTGASLVGISVDKNSTASNSGTITMKTTSNTGISSTGGAVTNTGTITLEKASSTGISSENGNVTNDSGATITAQEGSSVGIYSKLAGKDDVTVSNAGTISLSTASPAPSPAPEKSAAIYSLIDSGTGKLITINSGTINVDQTKSVGIYAENKGARDNSDVTNSGLINVKKTSSAGILGTKAKITNTGTGTTGGILLTAVKTAGIIANAGSLVSNTGRIETSGVTPTVATDGLVGISLNASIGTNETTGKITLGTEYSTGMNGVAKSVLTNSGTITGNKANAVGIAVNDSKATNTATGKIILNGLTSTGMFGAVGSTIINEGKIEGTQGNAVGMAGDASTVTNKNTISLAGKNSTGLFGKNNSTLLNDTDGKIELAEEESVGIYSDANTVLAINKGIINAVKKSSAGMLGKKGNIENTGTITTSAEESAVMYTENANATNKNILNANGKKSAGIYVKLTENNATVEGKNEGTGAVITTTAEQSAGMLGLLDGAITGSTSKLTLTNSGNVNVNSKESAGMMVTNNSNIDKANVKAENTGTITLASTTTTDDKNIGILANKNATGINSGSIEVNTVESVGMLGQLASEVVNKKTITLLGEKGIGMLAKDASSTATNEDTINVTGKKSSGMLAKEDGKAENKKNINVTAEGGVEIFVSDTGKGTNLSGANIFVKNKEAVGMFAKNNGSTHTAENAGTISLENPNGKDYTSLIGMFAQGTASSKAGVTNKASVKNTGTINIGTKESVGMYAENNTGNLADVDLHNAGTININSQSSAGMYAPKSTISKVGKINLKDSTDSKGSSAVYISEGGKVLDTASAEINLGTVNQNRVAYYVDGKNTKTGDYSTLAGADIGKVVGYGVGVYLKGKTSNEAKIDTNTPKLDYTLHGATGDGIIGLFLDGDTNIAAYNKGITVGNSVGVNTTAPKYAIGIYAKAQGDPAGTAYNITTPIKVGADGVGIYADKDSNINYNGTMEVGDGTTAGTGVFITKKEGANAGKVTLNGSTIKLKGTGGVGVIASEGTTIDAKNATVELIGNNIKGVGIYAKKGSTVYTTGWTFKNNGNQAEEVRSEEGKVPISGAKLLNPKMVLSHVINGETHVATGSTVTSTNDGSYTAKENIGLMAEGVKNPTAPAPLTSWDEADFEAVNHGTIDFSAAEKSTAMFINSARAKNDGIIKVGKNSTAIYGIYNKNTRKYEGASLPPDTNKLEIKTTANSKISLGDQSTGMYLINAEKINNIGGEITSESGATKNVGIYAINGQDADDENNKTLTMTTATKITLGNGAVGLYSKGKSNTVRNTVTNTGNITVGNTIIENKGTSNERRYPAVAIYAENTNLNTNSAIRVGNDGIAFYGKNSNITAEGTVDFSNKGVLAYLDKSNFISKLGNLGATQNTMLYLKDSTAQLDGAGSKVDMDVADGYTGAYISGNSQLTGVRKIKLGQGSTGIYLENTSPNFVSTADSIEGTKDNARGIVGINANFENNSKISLSGKESIGIYAKNTSASSKNVVNNGELNLSGEKTLGAYLIGKQLFENKADINIVDSADAKKPTIGIYTATTVEKDGAGNVIATYEGSDIKHSTGTIEVGEKSIGIYSKTSSSVEMTGGKVHVKDQGIGIYKEGGKLTVNGELDIDKHVATTKDSEPVGVYAVNGTEVIDQASKITVGERSYGFILNNTDPNKTNVYTNTNAGPVSLGNDSVFLYSNGKANITNNRTINSNNSDHLIGFYVKNGGELLNNGIIDFSTGKGNIGIYAPAGKATNKGKIFVGSTDDIDPATGKAYSDPTKIVYGIGMAADNGGHIINEGDIKISNNKSIGMYGAGVGTTVENKGNILLDGSKATATNKIGSMTGVYVDEGATFKNYGTIKTTDSYAGRNGKINDNVAGLVGVAVMNGSTLINEATGKIHIDADKSTGVIIRGKRDANGNLIRRAVIKNYGEIKVRGTGGTAISWKDLTPADIAELQRQINAKLISTDPKGHELGEASGTDKDYQGVTITVKNGQATFLRNGVPVSDSEVEKINKLIGNQPNLAMSDVGFYVDTLGRTRPVTFDGVTPPVNSQLIIGTEYSERTNKKEWLVSGEVIKPFLDQIQGRNYKITSMAGSLTWIATPVLDNYGQIVGVAMSKLSYTSFVKPEDNAYNFTDGLEQRYDMNGINTPEKRLFNKLNSIGKNEETLLTQAYDEMMGHQYANTQQRIQATGKVLDKEFSYLRNSWSNPSKDSNKIKTFGMSGEYKTDTAGIIDYKNNAYGVAYVHEDESVRLGEGTGWYTGIVHNTFKFKDIGNSKEEQLQGKVGLFKSIPFDYNNSLNWTVSGDVFVGYNKMHRKFLVVDEVFNAKSRYNTYGIGIKNELGKEFRLSEGFSVRPYGALKVEYGRVSKIKEKSGEVKLEVKSNDYLSVKPEIGAELAYKLFLGNKALRAAVTVAYENELGRVANGKNKARVAGTTADYFNIRGEKEDRRGNVKTDLNIGIDNQKVGVTGNIGYDTKGKNIRGGLGLRVIF